MLENLDDILSREWSAEGYTEMSWATARALVPGNIPDMYVRMCLHPVGERPSYLGSMLVSHYRCQGGIGRFVKDVVVTYAAASVAATQPGKPEREQTD